MAESQRGGLGGRAPGAARGAPRRDRAPRGPRNDEKAWEPLTKLGRLVNAGKI